MFYIWHTLLVTAFLGIAYYLGYRLGLKKKIKVASQKKTWDILKSKYKQEVEFDTPEALAHAEVSPNESSEFTFPITENKITCKFTNIFSQQLECFDEVFLTSII